MAKTKNIEGLKEQNDALQETIAEREAPGDRPVQVRKVTRRVVFNLTEAEIGDKARAAAELRVQVAMAEAELSGIKSQFKERIEELDGALGEHLSCIRRGKEERKADVEDRYDYARGVVETVHKGEVVEHRTMTAEERQLGLFPEGTTEEPSTDDDAATAAH